MVKNKTIANVAIIDAGY